MADRFRGRFPSEGLVEGYRGYRRLAIERGLPVRTGEGSRNESFVREHDHEGLRAKSPFGDDDDSDWRRVYRTSGGKRHGWRVADE